MSGIDLRERELELRASRQRFVAATVVRAERPTSAKPGDAALVLADGTLVGFVGGDCAQATVQVQALAAMESGEPVLLRITPDAENAPEETGSITVHNPCLSGGTLEIFLEPAIPAPLVVIHGDAPIARAVAGLAERVGYDLEAWAGPELPADTTAVVVAAHGRGEAEVLLAAVRAGVPYIGLVASARRAMGVLDVLSLSERERASIHTPAGLDIGARTPEEVALSILAEIVATRPRVTVRRDTTPPPTTAVDPVCGMSVATLDATLHADRDGVRYWFCGSGCLQAFMDQ
ncbi:MAG TPA: XdhC family protein [Acidimicrobiales bacterium]|nr:XdhC family protein [Acidimicrobiales bacterium]